MIYEIKPYSCYDNWTVSADGENISNIIDKLLRITTKVTERFAGDILYDIRTLDSAVHNGKHFDRVLVFIEDAVHSFDVEDGRVSHPNYLSGIQVWRITHNPETAATVLTRVYLRMDCGGIHIETVGM